MASIPIVLTPLPVPSNLKASGISELVHILASYLQGAINTEEVSFFRQGALDPQSNVGIFYNTSSQKFKVWDVGIGQYIPISDLQIGDVKFSYIQADQLSKGWLRLDGRKVAAITGLSTAQLNIVNTLFPSGELPTLKSIGLSPTALPVPTPISGVSGPTPSGVSALTIGATYTQAQIVALRDNAGAELAQAFQDLRTATELAEVQTRNVIANMFVTYPVNFAKIYIGTR